MINATRHTRGMPLRELPGQKYLPQLVQCPIEACVWQSYSRHARRAAQRPGFYRCAQSHRFAIGNLQTELLRAVRKSPLFENHLISELAGRGAHNMSVCVRGVKALTSLLKTATHCVVAKI